MGGSSTATNYEPRVDRTGSDCTLVVRETGLFCIKEGIPELVGTIALSHDVMSNVRRQQCGDSSSHFQEVHDPAVQTFRVHAISGDGQTNSLADKICEDFNQHVSLNHKKTKTFSKSSTFPCASEVQSCTKSVDKNSLYVEVDDQTLADSRGPSYTRSMSLPVPIKLVSAMKGGRESNGESPKINLHVKWAADVYDPPVTSVSHTLRSHPQCTKAKKKWNCRRKHKQDKGKSPQRASNERKNIHHRPVGNITAPADARPQASIDKSVLDKCGCSDVDYAVNGQDGKCGSNFLKEPLTKLHMPVC